MLDRERAAGGMLWRLAATAPDESAADAATAVLGTAAGAVSAFETSPGGAWQVEAYADREPDLAELRAAAALAAMTHGVGGEAVLGDLVVERLAPRDWVGENQQSFPPLRAGRFFIHGSHFAGAAPTGAIALCIDAATAFGTGEHATTRGCLLALDALGRRRRCRNVLDMGTGTGVLAMAAARLWPEASVLACDIDAGSVAVARTNLAVNRLAHRIAAAHGDGYRAAAVRRGRPFDLVLANILARPLAAMACDLAGHLEPGGLAVLSGLLACQAPLVLAAHRAVGLRLLRRRDISGWTTLVLRRGGEASAG